ncbi:hypothetical protein [Vibrio sagamiensis]|uniref:Uncharacterized protein n=1 Tax=Vibrio sagamiensis NBRC 104589 TaxID=1219064 RepID=A0A511QBP2_9VIBR|nr:hypothetical protein [Vibrio sagamiensis]PNQ58482.1 hypothetical protein C1141_13150 [Vibrio agarivorans]GEM74715.1 hypothetical protein VSA01S_08270 [Vibrio sagamiensis NBRC 104589]
MPLIACPVCEKQISKRAHTCPGCGEPDPLNHLAKSKLLSFIFWSIVLFCLGYISWFYLVPMIVEALRNH